MESSESLRGKQKKTTPRLLEAMDVLGSAKVNRRVFEVTSLFEQTDEKRFWLTRTPAERLQAVELMRQVLYGYDPSTVRLQRVLEITQRSSG
ncbi:hypothetical protein [Rhodothermus marinus]|uniref:hypothetical protein n=1 Tax=Rhodothermus marinus TaxID=29549 RepID=UPI001FB38F4D|nr:hypothetical protein [Rhodothermus marinus]